MVSCPLSPPLPLTGSCKILVYMGMNPLQPTGNMVLRPQSPPLPLLGSCKILVWEGMNPLQPTNNMVLFPLSFLLPLLDSCKILVSVWMNPLQPTSTCYHVPCLLLFHFQDQHVFIGKSNPSLIICNGPYSSIFRKIEGPIIFVFTVETRKCEIFFEKIIKKDTATEIS